jgi:hypothetical protein
MRIVVVALLLVLVLTVVLIAQAVFDDALAAWIAMGVTSVICIAAVILGALPGGPSSDS